MRLALEQKLTFCNSLLEYFIVTGHGIRVAFISTQKRTTENIS